MASYDLSVVVVIATTFAIALAFIILRMVARRVTRVDIWWDDYLAIAAFLFSAAWCAVVMQCKCSQTA